MNFILKFYSFLREVKVEMDRVAWPDRKLAMNATIGVIVFSIIVAIFIASLDFIFSRLIGVILR